MSDLNQPISGEWLTEIGWLDYGSSRPSPNLRWYWYPDTKCIYYGGCLRSHIKTRGQLLLAMLAMGDTAPGTEIIERQLRAAEYVERYGICTLRLYCVGKKCVWRASHDDASREYDATSWHDAVIAMGEHLDQQGATNAKN
jgi:hypothetical protein